MSIVACRLSLASLVGLSLLAASSVQAGGPSFTELVGALDPQPCTPAGCWTNYLRVTDLDGDGDLDIVFVNYDGFFEVGTAEPLVIYENDGNAGFTNVSDVAVADYTGRIRQVAIGDVDGDGDPDMYVPSAQAEGDAFFINDGLGVFTDEVDSRLPGLQSRAGAARFADVDNDGDLDLFLSDGYDSNNPAGHIYLNDGTGVFEELAGATPTPGGFDIDDVDVLDVDRDFDLDILVNPHSGDNSLWINDGTGMFTDGTKGLPGQDNQFHYNPGVCDVDGDGDLDVWIDNMGPSPRGEQLLINDGTGVFTDETLTRVTGNSNTADDNGVTCVDLDNDGDFDAVVWSLSSSGERYLENDGTGNFTLVGGTFPTIVDGTLWGEMGDLDGDDRIDAVTGQGEGSSTNRVYLAGRMVPVDDRPPLIITHETAPESVPADEPVVLRYAVSDRVVSDEGARVSAFARVTVGGDTSTVPALFMGGDLFRAEIPGRAGGSTVDVELCATDRAGNESCTEAQSYMVQEGAATSGGTETGGEQTSGTPGTDGTNTATASDTATGGNTMSGTITDSAGTDSGSAGDTDTDGAGQTDEDGCGCTSTPTPSGGAAALALLAVFGLRRRRR